MKTLEERRNIQGVLFIFKLLKNYINSSELLRLINIKLPHSRLKKKIKRYIPLKIQPKRVQSALDLAMKA